MRRGLTAFLLLAWAATAVFAGVQTVRIAWLETELARRADTGSIHLDTGNGQLERTAGENLADKGGNSGDTAPGAQSDFWGDITNPAGDGTTAEDNLFMKNLVDSALASMMADPVAGSAPKSRRQLKKEMLQDMGVRSDAGGGVGPGSAGGNNAGSSSSGGNTDGLPGNIPRKESPKASPVDPRSLQLAQQAREAQKQGNYEQALDLYRQSIETDPQNRTAYQALGTLQKKLGLYQDELATYQQWADVIPGDPTARYLMADAYARNGANDLALQQLEQFLGMAGNDLRAYPMAADLYRRMGMPDAEQAILEQWVAAAPQSPDALGALANNYRRQGNYAAAEQTYTDLLQMRPEDTEVRARLSALYQQQGRYTEALQLLDEAVSMRPNDVRLLSQLAEAQRRAGNMEGAIAAYQQVIAAQPGSEAAINAERNITRIERQMERQNAQAVPKPRPPKPPKSP